MANTSNVPEGRSQPDERLTIRFEADTIDDVDALVEDGHYANRSEAIRQGVRDLVEDER